LLLWQPNLIMPVEIDIVILSFAKDEKLKAITQQGIDTLLASEDPAQIKFKVLVIESNKALQPYQFSGTQTIYPLEDFGFNKYLNLGIKQTHSKYIALCNNDLIFHKGWASEILKAMDKDQQLMSVTPYCADFHTKLGFDPDGAVQEGYFGTFVGWCFFVKREMFDMIGLLDEKFKFWYADADYCNVLEKHKIKNCLVPASRVTHLGSESLKSVTDKDQQKLTQLPRFYYAYKWQHHSWIKYKLQTLLFKTKMLLGL
jgi:GT2 family glycosyltransferase